MTISASHLLHVHAGSPSMPGCVDIAPAACWVCGAIATRAMPIDRWMGANFTGQNRVRAPGSPWVCEPCVWAMAGRPPDTLRMYSHLLEVGGEYLKPNKGGKPAMRAFLRRPHASTWFAAIADSGQKHIVPWAPVNPPGSRGRVLFEETLVTLPDAAGWALVDEMADMLTAGATKEEMSTARYEARAWQLCGDRLRAFEARWGRLRGGGWFGLALWLAQRDEAAVAERMAAEKAQREAKRAAEKAAKKGAKGGTTQRRAARDAAHEDGGVSARGARRVPARGSKPAQALGAATESRPVGGAAEYDGGRVDDGASARTPDPDARQLGLPGFA